MGLHSERDNLLQMGASKGQALLSDVLTTSHVKMKMNSAQDVCRSRDSSLVGEN